MSTRYDTICIVLANGNGTLSDGRPSVLAEIDGVTVLERAIDAHMAAWTRGSASTPIVVVVDAEQSEIIREVDMATYDSGLVRCALIPDPDGPKDAITAALAQLRSLDVYSDNVVISMGNAGLWRPETLRAVRDTHLATRKERASVMTLATVHWNIHPEAFWNHGIAVYAGADKPLPGQIKKVLEYWEYGPEPRRNGQVDIGVLGGDVKVLEYWEYGPEPRRNGQVDIGVLGGDVSAKLFCIDFAWLLDCVERYSAQYQSRNLPPECFLHGLVSVAYKQRQPTALFRLPDAQAHEALCIRRDYDLEYVREKLQSLSPEDNMPDAATRFATEYVAVARAV